MDYRASKLYQRTLAVQPQTESPCGRLRRAYEDMRQTMVQILGKIITDFPNLTIHDITHVDKLWEVADVIIGEDYPVSPLEGFILGCAFLIHDSALSYEAVGGKDKLRQLVYWKDAYAEMANSDSLSVEEKEKKADFEAIRYIHAQEAERMITQVYQKASGETFYILSDRTLRLHLGELIGLVAASHHWSIEQVSALPTQYNAIDGFPREWRVNPLKLACILRCADAGHIDMGRAPDNLYSVLDLHGVSAQHWNAQNHLSLIDVDQSQKDRALITSSRPFKEQDFGAWNVAFDAIRILDAEIKASNKLLREKSAADGGPFAIKEIAGIASKEEMAKYIKTVGWEPFEANLHIDDVGGLIAKLGGEALYGNEDKLLTAIRELIQNARDAIHARYVVEPDFSEKGVIDIYVNQIHGDTYISVTDNGVGMSENVVKNCFLNFGCSLWNSSMVKTEYAGLCSSNFRAVGKYGIGFYSVFMIASAAEVMTRVYNKGTESAMLLKFPKGLTLTPIKQNVDSHSTSMSTRVTLKLNPEKYKWTKQYVIRGNTTNDSSFTTSFECVLKTLCAGLDTDVYYHENKQMTRRIHQNIHAADFDKRQWLRDISFADEQSNPNIDQLIEASYKRLEYIKDGDHICGLAAINISPSYRKDYLSISTIGGLASPGQIHGRGSEHYIGYMDSIPSGANRHAVSPMKVHTSSIEQWAQRQYTQILPQLNEVTRLHLPYVVSLFHVDTIDTCLVQIFSKRSLVQHITIRECVYRMKQEKARMVVLLSGYIRGTERHIETYVQLADVYNYLADTDVLLWPVHNSGILKVADGDDYTLYSFIKRQAAKDKVELQEYIQENKFRTILGPVDVLYIRAK